MSLQRDLSGFRYAETNFGDTLQAIALRELGDASRWPELVSFNGLRPPFITDDATLAGPGVLLTGKLIRVPAATPASVTTTDADELFETDAALTDGSLTASDGGDFALVAGIDNLRQALGHRLETSRGELAFHPDYGSLLRRIVGTVNGPTAGLLASSYAREAVALDPRVARVKSSDATVSGDVVRVDLVAEPIVGKAINISQVL